MAEGSAIEPGEWVELCVTDTGSGIRPEDRERLLNDFGLVDAGLAPSPRSGLGMGLALARKLVDLHGGRMWLDSPGGGGTAVKFVLPLVARSASPTPAPSGSPSAGGEPLVLVIEDEPTTSDLLVHYLMEAGYAVARAYTAAQGLALARSLRPVAITLDPALPDGDGLDVLAELRSDPALGDVTVVVVSVSEEHPRAAELGAVAWIRKPVDRGELLGVLRRRHAAGSLAGHRAARAVDP